MEENKYEYVTPTKLVYLTSTTMKVTENATIAKKRLFFEKLPRIFQKLVLFLAISMMMTDNYDKKIILKKLPYIYYPV